MMISAVNKHLHILSDSGLEESKGMTRNPLYRLRLVIKEPRSCYSQSGFFYLFFNPLRVSETKQ